MKKFTVVLLAAAIMVSMLGCASLPKDVQIETDSVLTDVRKLATEIARTYRNFDQQRYYNRFSSPDEITLDGDVTTYPVTFVKEWNARYSDKGIAVLTVTLDAKYRNSGVFYLSNIEIQKQEGQKAGEWKWTFDGLTDETSDREYGSFKTVFTSQKAYKIVPVLEMKGWGFGKPGDAFSNVVTATIVSPKGKNWIINVNPTGLDIQSGKGDKRWNNVKIITPDISEEFYNRLDIIKQTHKL